MNDYAGDVEREVLSSMSIIPMQSALSRRSLINLMHILKKRNAPIRRMVIPESNKS